MEGKPTKNKLINRGVLHKQEFSPVQQHETFNSVITHTKNLKMLPMPTK